MLGILIFRCPVIWWSTSRSLFCSCSLSHPPLSHTFLVWHQRPCYGVVNIYGLCVLWRWRAVKSFPDRSGCMHLSPWRLEQEQEPERKTDEMIGQTCTSYSHCCWQQLWTSTCLLNRFHSANISACSLSLSLWLVYRQCHPGKQRSLTSQSSSVAEKPLKFALISTAAAESCRGGGWWCWVWGLVV